MLVELDEIQDEQEHRRFCLGCLRTVTAMRITTAVSTSPRGGRSLRIGVLGAMPSLPSPSPPTASCTLSDAPGVSHGSPWALLLLTLLAYGASTLTLSQGATRQARIARRNGLIGGILIGTAWLFALNPTGPLKPWVAVPLAFAIRAPVGTRHTHGTRHARRASRGRNLDLERDHRRSCSPTSLGSRPPTSATEEPYDPQLLRDFHHSGSHDLIAPVSNNLWSALSLLVLIPLSQWRSAQ